MTGTSEPSPADGQQIRRATPGDAAAVCDLAGRLAQSFPFSPARFHDNYTALLTTAGACVLVATEGDETLGYLLGFSHRTFYANGPVAQVEEILVRPQSRTHGIGRALMRAFEDWAAHQGCAVVALATRRAAPFYLALGYEESATYLRKVLSARDSR
jgi:GNAT superfamily N-acetyltransferase